VFPDVPSLANGGTSEYVAIVENGRSRSIPVKDKEFSQYVAGDTKSAESN
jgi:hypothetical protein